MVYTRIIPTIPKGLSSSLFTSVPSKQKPTIVIDLDETILYRPGGVWDAFLMYAFRNRGAKVGVPYPSAVTAIHHLASRYHFVGLTARWYRAEHSTIGWLKGAGLDGLPVIFAKEMHPADDSRSAYKAAAIAYLRNEGWNPVIGIGDRPSDMVAYTTENLRTFMVAHQEGTRSGDPLRHTLKLLNTEIKIRSTQRKDTRGLPHIQYFSDDLFVHQYFKEKYPPLTDTTTGSTTATKSTIINTHHPRLFDPSSIRISQGHTTPSSEHPLPHSSSHSSSSSVHSHHHSHSSAFSTPSPLPPVWTQIRNLLEQEHQEKDTTTMH